MSSPTNVLAFAASNSSHSINKKLVTHAASVLKDEILSGVEITTLDLNDFEMPIYSVDREDEHGIPEQAKAFYAAIGQADILLISYAEHNGHYSAAFKNIFDWCSRIEMKIFQDKPMVIMATSPGGRGGASVLKAANESAGHFGAEVKGSLSVPNFYQTFDAEKGVLIDIDLAAALRKQLLLLK